MLIDTGPIVALIDADDLHHSRCRSLLPSLPTPLVTTTPCFTEAHYLLGRNLGYRGQQTLWKWRQIGIIRLHYSNTTEDDAMESLMAKYGDTPMDYADASLMAAAETLRDLHIFTLDSHFYAYRFADGSVPQVFP